jgi:putative acetyltransferase
VPDPAAQLVHAHTPDWLPVARAIFAEYAASIAEVAGCSLQHQGIDAELASLPGLYAPPRGCMLLAVGDHPQAPADARVLGCIALRPLPALGSDVCEMKRMYVRPAHRGQGLGLLLGRAVIQHARDAGYRVMKLDTSDTMHAAIALYRCLGFQPCPRYNDDPMTDTLWFDLAL